MKLTYALVLTSALFGTAALANDFGVRPIISPENTVQVAALQYISQNAETSKDGSVNSPCKREEGMGNTLRVTCTGKYKFLGPGGGKMFSQKFSCEAEFQIDATNRPQLLTGPTCADITPSKK